MARSAPSLRVFSCLPTVVYLQIVFPIEVQQVLAAGVISPAALSLFAPLP